MSSIEFKQIGGNGFPWPAENRMAHQRLLLLFCGECVANAALGDVFLYFSVHSWPIEGFSGSSQTALDSQMAGM